MKLKQRSIATIALLLLSFYFGRAQTFTMGKKCKEALATGTAANQAGDYQTALTTFESNQDNCKTKDGKEAFAVGKAEALNGLGRYDEAIAAADVALDATKGNSLNGHFQKGVAQNKLGQIEASQASLNQVMVLTDMNQNTAERASNYALMAALYDRQLGNSDSAMHYMDKAIAMDPTNTNFVIEKGDMFVRSQQYDAAFEQYDKAVEMGRSDVEMYEIRANARLKMLESKYQTTKAKELKTKMTPAEKELVCSDLQQALDMGLKDMNKDMFAALVCN